MDGYTFAGVHQSSLLCVLEKLRCGTPTFSDAQPQSFFSGYSCAAHVNNGFEWQKAPKKKAQGPQWRLCFLTSHCGGQRVHCNWQRWGRLLRKYSFTSSQSTGGKNFRELNWRDGCAPHKYQSNACVFSHVDVDDLRLCHAHKIIVSVWFLKTQICYNQCQSLIISNCQDNPSVAALDAD